MGIFSPTVDSLLDNFLKMKTNQKGIKSDSNSDVSAIVITDEKGSSTDHKKFTKKISQKF